MNEKGFESRIYSSEEFTKDPVMFGAMMEFQYGTGASQKEAEQLLFEEGQGITCDDFDELGVALPRLKFWKELTEQLEEQPRYRLYMNNTQVSLFAARLLQDFGYQFQPVIRQKTRALPVRGRKKVPLPIFVDLKNGTSRGSLTEVKNYLRKKILSEFSQESYTVTQRDFTKKVFLPGEVFLVDNTKKRSFKTKITEASFPVQEMLKEHYYVQRVGLDAFPWLVVWKAGLWSELRNKVNKDQRLILESPPVVLFEDEVQALSNGKEKLIVEESGSAYHVTYDAYFIIDGQFYRIYGHLID